MGQMLRIRDTEAAVFSTSAQSADPEPEDYVRRIIEVAKWSEEAGCTGARIHGQPPRGCVAGRSYHPREHETSVPAGRCPTGVHASLYRGEHDCLLRVPLPPPHFPEHPELTDRVLRPHPFPPAGPAEGERVCYSGDLVRSDEDGFLYFVGRRDDQIESAEFRISPTEVEEVICRVAAVHQAAVVGVPDTVLGQHLVAFVVPEERTELDPADTLAQCADAMPRYMVPKRIELVDDLPMTSSGKVNYPKLRDQLASQNPRSA